MANDFSLKAVFGADTRPLEQSIKRAENVVKSFAAGMVGYLSVRSVINEFTKSLDIGGKLTDMKAKTGIGTAALYDLGEAGRDAGLSLDEIASSVNKLQKGLGQPGSENVLRALGLDGQSLASGKPEEAFRKVGLAIGNLKNPTEQVQASMALFGKSGAQMLQLFNDPAFKAGIGSSNTAKLLGENAGIFDKASDSLGRVGSRMQGLFIGIASNSAGMLNSLSDFIDGMDLSSIGQSIGNAVSLFVTAFSSGNFSTILSSSFMIAIKEAINFLSAGFFAVFQTIPAYLSTIGKNFVAYFELLTNPEFWSGLKDSFLSVAAAFRGTMLMGVANILDAMRDIPGIGGRIGSAADAVRGMSDGQFQQSAAYSESAANGGMGAAVNKLAEQLKNNISGLGSEFLRNFAANGKIMGGTDAERAALGKAIADTIAARDQSNANARAANAGRGVGQGAYDGTDIGMAGKSSIVADSLAKVGGGGISIGGMSNPILEENKRQTALLQRIAENGSKMAYAGEAAWNSGF